MSPSILHFLSALGNAVLNSLWQMALLWLLVIAIIKYRKNISAPRLSNLGFIALTTGFIAFVITFLISFYTPQTDAGMLALINDTGIAEKIMSFSAGLYIVLLIIPLIKLATGYNAVISLRKTALRRAPGHYKIFILNAINCIGIKRNVKLWISDLASTPLTIGFLKPVILLPVAVINNLSTAQVEAIILHELAHIKRNDYLINFICQLIISFLYFNPFAKALLRLQNTETEKTADEQVLQFGYSNHLYAGTLLHIARENSEQQLKLALQAANRRSPLYTRVQWIMGLRKRSLPPGRNIAAAIGTMILFFATSLIVNNNKPETKTASTIGNLNFGIAPVFVTDNKTQTDDFTIRAIPSIETEPSTKENTVYLKQVEDPKTGKVEIVTPSDPVSVPAYILVAAAKPDIPALTLRQEQQVQQYIELVKKIAAENAWAEIEKSLAESVTTDQKEQLKEIFIRMVGATDWSGQADRLRLAYDSIDWGEARAKIDLAMANIQLDSLHNHYTAAVEKYETLKKGWDEKHDKELSEKIAEAEKALKQLDSLRKKRIVEL